MGKDKPAYCPPQGVGIYVHVPFCANGKCPYCDFYSVKGSEELKEKYMSAVEKDMRGRSPEAESRTADTVYFGGGTPSLLGVGLARLLKSIKENFHVAPDAEITFEANPSFEKEKAGVDIETLKFLRRAGFNRISLGMQSGIDSELAALGRRHTKDDVKNAVLDARCAGFDNISLDLMLCTPTQTRETLMRSVDFAASLRPRHISAYLLKIEKGTRFFDEKEALGLPNDDAQADMYLAACEALEKHGFFQYEISNFAQKGYESRHNTRYWNCDEYLGFGPAAHSFFNGRRFFYTRSLEDYISGKKPCPDGDGGSLEEYVMLRLRLCDGISEKDMLGRYGVGFSFFDAKTVALLSQNGLLKVENGSLSLTRNGFLVSNAVIGKLLFH